MTSLFLTKNKPIPMHCRIPYSMLQKQQPARTEIFDFLIKTDNYPVPLLYGETEEYEYLYHLRGSVPEEGHYHEVVWYKGQDIIFWDDTFRIPVAVGVLSDIAFTGGHDDMYYLHVTVHQDQVLPWEPKLYYHLMERLLPLIGEGKALWEFITGMDIHTAKQVHDYMLYFGVDDEHPVFLYNSWGTLSWHPAFTVQYINYPNERYMSESIIKFVTTFVIPALPTSGDWTGKCDITIHKDYSIEIWMSKNDTLYEDGIETDIWPVDVTLTLHRSKYAAKWYWDAEEDLKFEWEERESDDDWDQYTGDREDFIWQGLDATFGLFTISKEEEL